MTSEMDAAALGGSSPVEALAKRLHAKMCKLESDYEEWSGLAEADKDFCRALVRDLLTVPDLIKAALNCESAQERPQNSLYCDEHGHWSGSIYLGPDFNVPGS